MPAAFYAAHRDGPPCPIRQQPLTVAAESPADQARLVTTTDLHNLPAALTPLIGRETELHDLQQRGERQGGEQSGKQTAKRQGDHHPAV